MEMETAYIYNTAWEVFVMFYCFNSEIVTNMKLISFNMFETVASDANDKYHNWVYNKLSFNATKSNSID